MAIGLNHSIKVAIKAVETANQFTNEAIFVFAISRKACSKTNFTRDSWHHLFRTN